MKRLKDLRNLFWSREEGVSRSAPADLRLPDAIFDQKVRRLLDLSSEIVRIAPERGEALLTCLRDGIAGGINENAQYRIAEELAGAVYPKYKFSEYARIFLEDREFLTYYQHFMDPGNWHSLDRKYTLDQLLRLTLHLSGDVAECGAYKGASAYLMCRAHRDTGQVVHLFDSFEGLSEPGELDGEYWKRGALTAAERVLCENLADFENYRVYKGWIPKRFLEVAERSFAFVHIDVDLYQPTLDSLEFFFGRVVPGGIILMDDYGFATCPGAKAAADKFFNDKAERLIMLPTGQAFAVKR